MFVRKTSQAFTLIEMMVVVVVLGLMATVILPRMNRRSPSAEWPNILDDLNNLVLFARQEAISNQKPYRLKFRAPRTIIVEEEKIDPENPAKKFYEWSSCGYFDTKHMLSEYITLDGVYWGKKEMMVDNKNESFCYVIADGLVQEVIVHMTRQYQGEVSKASFRMSPFIGQFEFFDGHVKSER
ncbi:MAG: prepilin-type N-terminal cleavage/methylation domain-containing protein [bacterium]